MAIPGETDGPATRTSIVAERAHMPGERTSAHPGHAGDLSDMPQIRSSPIVPEASAYRDLDLGSRHDGAYLAGDDDGVDVSLSPATAPGADPLPTDGTGGRHTGQYLWSSTRRPHSSGSGWTSPMTAGSPVVSSGTRIGNAVGGHARSSAAEPPIAVLSFGPYRCTLH